MNKTEGIRFLTITLTISTLFLLFLFIGCLDLINDKNMYINGLLSDRSICNGKLDSITNDYTKMENELNKYKEKYGEIE